MYKDPDITILFFNVAFYMNINMYVQSAAVAYKDYQYLNLLWKQLFCSTFYSKPVIYVTITVDTFFTSNL